MGASGFDKFSPGILAGWEQHLLRRLTAAGSRAADWQFQVFKTARTAFPSSRHASYRQLPQLIGEFIGSSPRGRLDHLFREFHALKPLCEVLCTNWICAITEFFGHLAADREVLEQRFAAAHPLGQATEVEAGLSDSHDGGRCVVRVTFENGTRLIYKPRSLAPEVHFAALIKQINARAVLHRLKAAWSWDRGKYGWMEDVQVAPCGTPAEVRAFYWRMGVLLGLVHLTRGIDFHQENLIAAGEFPVLIDLETLWHFQVPSGPQTHLTSTSVLQTGFLPRNDRRAKMTYRWSALALTEDPALHSQQQPHRWKGAMSRHGTAPDAVAKHHLVILNGAFQPASEFVNEVVAGFCWLGELLSVNQDAREEFSRWLDALIRCPRRLVPRSTSKYQPILEQLTSPSSLRRENASLKGLPAWNSTRWLELPGERQALEQLDIPRFEQEAFDHAKALLTTFDGWSIKDYLNQIPMILDSLTPNRN